MARQEAIEKWRSRAQDAEADRDHAVMLLRQLLDVKKDYSLWNSYRKEAIKFLKIMEV